MISEPYPSISRSSPQNVADESRRFPALATPVWVFNESEKAELPAAFQSVAKEAFPGVLLVRKTEEPDKETAKETSDYAVADARKPINLYPASTKLKLAIRSAFISRILTNKSGLNNESLSLRSSPGKYSCVVNLGPWAA
jgi:hypothetical protein